VQTSFLASYCKPPHLPERKWLTGMKDMVLPNLEVFRRAQAPQGIGQETREELKLLIARRTLIFAVHICHFLD